MSQERLFLSIEPMILRPEGSQDQPIFSNQEPLMMESGRVDSETAEVFRNGLMVPYMKVNGKTIEHMDKASSLILMEISMRASGSMTKPMVTVSTIILMVLAMRATGEKISNMGMAKRVGPMAQYMRVNI